MIHSREQEARACNKDGLDDRNEGAGDQDRVCSRAGLVEKRRPERESGNENGVGLDIKLWETGMINLEHWETKD